LQESPPDGREIIFSYLKSTQFRVVHVDGAVGSLTPSGLLHIACYNERPAIPRSTVHTVDRDGKLSGPLSSEGKDGIVREMEVDLMMTIQVAKNIHDWLAQRIAEFDAATSDNGTH